MSDQKKNNTSGKLAAFTIAEMVVVALLTVITVAIGFTALDLINQQFAAYGKDSDRVLVYSDLTRLLNRDFLLCDQVLTSTGRDVRLQYDSMTITYSLEANHLLRSSSILGSRIDTFYLEVTDFSPTFDGQEVTTGWVDYLRIKIMLDDREQYLLFSKNYAAEDLYRRASLEI